MPLDYEKFNSYFKVCRDLKKPFVVTVSNYSYKIESELIKYNSIHEQKSMKFFAASSKVKSDCLKKELPVINKRDLRYFNFELKEENFCHENIYGIDLKNAYATVLLKNGFISKETYGYLSTLSKMDRLGSLGMLAGKKKIISFGANGKEIESESYTKKKETENYFFYAVLQVAYLMEECRKMLQDDFLFSWVDCVYFKSEESFEMIENFLKDNDFFYHKKYYKKFKHEMVSEDFRKVFMWEKGETKSTMKIFYPPTKRKKIIEEISEIIKNNEYL